MKQLKRLAAVAQEAFLSLRRQEGREPEVLVNPVVTVLLAQIVKL